MSLPRLNKKEVDFHIKIMIAFIEGKLDFDIDTLEKEYIRVRDFVGKLTLDMSIDSLFRNSATYRIVLWKRIEARRKKLGLEPTKIDKNR